MEQNYCNEHHKTQQDLINIIGKFTVLEERFINAIDTLKTIMEQNESHRSERVNSTIRQFEKMEENFKNEITEIKKEIKRIADLSKFSFKDLIPWFITLFSIAITIILTLYKMVGGNS